MTFQELAESLPNGFHDAELLRFEMDYADRTLKFDLDIWVGDLESNDTKELYRRAQVTLHSVAYLVIEPPDPSYPWDTTDHIRIDTGEGKPPQSESVLPPAPVGTATTWMYLMEMNRFLLFAAGNASLEWASNAVNRT